MSLGTKIALSLLLALILLCGWLLWNMTWIEHEVDSGFTDDARARNYLAATLFLQQQGSQAEQRRSFALLDTLGAADNPVQATDTLLLVEALNVLSSRQIDNLLTWVEQGGTAFYATHNRLQGESLEMEDGLLEALGILLVSEPQPELTETELDAEARLQRAVDEYVQDRNELQCDGSSPLTEFKGGDASRRGQLQFAGNRSLKSLFSKRSNYVSYGDARGTQMMIAPLGTGKFVVTTDAHVWDNNHLACFDHAYALHYYSTGSKTWLLENGSAQSLLSRLWSLSAAGCLLTLLATVLLLHRGSRRFGPALAATSVSRRSFLEHLEAGAQLLWSKQQGAYLIEFLRKDIHTRMQKLDYRFAILTPAEQRELIAHTTRLPLSTVAEVMGNVLPAKPSRERLQDWVALLQKIRALL